MQTAAAIFAAAIVCAQVTAPYSSGFDYGT